jgi:hypothetical protein
MGGSDYRIAQQTKQAIDNELERIIVERAKNASNPEDRELFNLYREANKDYAHAKQIDIKELRAATNPIVNVNPFSVSHGGLGRVGHEGVALAGLILGSHLGPVGGLIGGAAGFALGKAGQILVHKVKGKFAAYFYKQAMKGELTAAQATALATRATTQSFANKIPKIIKEISKAGGKAEVDKYFTKDHIDKLDTVKTLLGDKATGLSKSQQITALRKMIFESTDPRVLDNIKQELGSEFHDKPEALAALSSQLDKMAAALRNVFPEEPLKKPFQPAKPETFTKEQIRSINEQLAYIQNPEILLKDLADNKVQPKNVAMVAALYPSFMSRLQSEMAMQSNNVNLDSYKRLQAAYILGTQIDQNSIPAVIIQQIYDASAPQVGQQAPAPKSGKTGTKALSNGIQQYDTTFTHHPKSKA